MADHPPGVFFTKFGSSLAALFLVLVAAYAQAFHLLALGGVNPSLAPVALLALSFFEKNILVFMAGFFIILFFLFSLFWWPELLWFTLALAAALLIKTFFSWRDFPYALLSVGIFTALTFIVLPRSLSSQSAYLLIWELLLNCFLGGCFFYIFYVLKQRER